MARRLLLLLLFVILCESATAVSVCSVPGATNATSKAGQEVQDIGWYTKAMTTMMRAMIGEIEEETAKEMGQIVETPDDGHNHIMTIMLQYVLVTIIFVLLIIISIALLIAMIAKLISRWCRPAKEGLIPSKFQMFCTLFSFLLCGCICAAGAFVFFLSIQGVKDGLASIGNNLNSTSGHISAFVGNYETLMTCQTSNQDNQLDILVNQRIADISSQTGQFIQILTDTINEGNSLATDPAMKTEVQNVEAGLKNFITAMDGVNKTLTDMIRQGAGAFKTQYKNLLVVVDKVKQGFEQLEDRLMAVMVENNYYAGTASTAVQFSFLIPLILCGMMAFGFVVLVMRFFGNCVTGEGGKRNILSVIAGHLMGVTGYVAMLTGSLLFAIAAGTFLVAFASMYLCVGFFDDPDLLVFGAFPSLNKDINGFTLHEAFVRCKNEYPFFDAIDGEKQLAVDALAPLYRNISQTDFAAGFRDYTVPPTIFPALETAIAAASAAGSSTTQLMSYQDKLFHLNARAYRDERMLRIEDELDVALKSLADLAANQMAVVLDMSPQCEGMMKIWDTAGQFVCNSISMPAQGAWMACVFCGIAAFCVFHWAFKSTLYLKNYDNNYDGLKTKSDSPE